MPRITPKPTAASTADERNAMTAHDPHGHRVATLTGCAADLNDNVLLDELPDGSVRYRNRRGVVRTIPPGEYALVEADDLFRFAYGPWRERTIQQLHEESERANVAARLAAVEQYRRRDRVKIPGVTVRFFDRADVADVAAGLGVTVR